MGLSTTGNISLGLALVAGDHHQAEVGVLLQQRDGLQVPGVADVAADDD